MNRADLTPWADRSGRFSALRAVIFAAVAAPALQLALTGFGAFGGLGPEPVKAAMHFTGEWTLRLLLAALAATPLARLGGWRRLIGVRRMIGLAAFAYLAAHFALYFLYMNGMVGKVVSEIISRIYLTIGFVALLGLGALAATSFDRAIRAMGPNWRRLHRLAYLLTALGILHFFMQSKIDVSDPALLAGLFCGLMLLRARMLRPLAPEFAFLAAALLAGVSAAGLEALWHAVATGAPWVRVLQGNLDFAYEIRPPWIAAGIALLPALALLARRLVSEARPAAGPTP